MGGEGWGVTVGDVAISASPDQVSPSARLGEGREGKGSRCTNENVSCGWGEGGGGDLVPGDHGSGGG